MVQPTTATTCLHRLPTDGASVVCQFTRGVLLSLNILGRRQRWRRSSAESGIASANPTLLNIDVDGESSVERRYLCGMDATVSPPAPGRKNGVDCSGPESLHEHIEREGRRLPLGW